MRDATLREQVRSRIVDGRLPHDRIGRVSATYGADEVCDACSAVVSTGQILYKLVRWGVEQLVFHSACFAVWKVERELILSRYTQPE